MIERIAGIKLNLDKLNNHELDNLIEVQQSRVYEAQAGLTKLLGEAMLRGTLSPEVVWQQHD